MYIHKICESSIPLLGGQWCEGSGEVIIPVPGVNSYQPVWCLIPLITWRAETSTLRHISRHLSKFL